MECFFTNHTDFDFGKRATSQHSRDPVVQFVLATTNKIHFGGSSKKVSLPWFLFLRYYMIHGKKRGKQKKGKHSQNDDPMVPSLNEIKKSKHRSCESVLLIIMLLMISDEDCRKTQQSKICAISFSKQKISSIKKCPKWINYKFWMLLQVCSVEE